MRIFVNLSYRAPELAILIIIVIVANLVIVFVLYFESVYLKF